MAEARSRRSALGAALSGLFGAGSLALLGGNAEARKKGKKKKKCKGGKKKCGKTCIPATSCCANSECGTGGACVGGVCACAIGFKNCEGACIPQGDCCTAADCDLEETCQDGVCTAPFCAGINRCEDGPIDCSSNPNSPCVCWVRVGNGRPVCGLQMSFTDETCACPSGQVCVDLTGPECGGATRGCVEPCATPR